MRILTIMPGMNGGGGAERSLATVAPHLIRSGFELHLAVLTERQALVPELERSGVVVHDLSRARSLPQRIRAIRRATEQIGPSVVHATLWDATLPTQLALLGRSTPLLVTWANTAEPLARRRPDGPSPVKLALYRGAEIALGRVSRASYHAVSPGVARVNTPAFRADPSRVFVAERGREAPSSPPSQPRLEELRRSLGIDPASPVVVAVGRQDHQKAHVRLLDRWDEVVDASGAHLLVAGREGSATAELADRLGGLRHAGHVHLLGYRADVDDLLALADVFVSSSTHEGAAGAMLEAMAAGTPVVSTRVEGLAGVVEHGRTALVVEPDQLGEALIEALGDPEAARMRATRARRTFEERFTVERSAEALADVYRSVSTAVNP